MNLYPRYFNLLIRGKFLPCAIEYFGPELDKSFYARVDNRIIYIACLNSDLLAFVSTMRFSLFFLPFRLFLDCGKIFMFILCCVICSGISLPQWKGIPL